MSLQDMSWTALQQMKRFTEKRLGIAQDELSRLVASDMDNHYAAILRKGGAIEAHRLYLSAIGAELRRKKEAGDG